MVVLGLVLVVVAAVVGAEIFVSNTQQTTAEAFNVSLADVSLGGFFLAGALTTLVLLFGISLINSGLTRGRKQRAARKEIEARQRDAERKSEEEKAAALAEAERLREELAEERMNQATLGGVVTPPDALSEPYPIESGPVDDPEHAEDDHRGVLGRLRGDRS